MNTIASLVPYKIVPAITGGEKGIFLFLKYAANHNPITCFTVAENEGNVSRIEFVPILGSTLNKARYINPALYYKIKKECISRGIKHVIIEHPYYAWLGVWLKKYAGLKLVIHSHNIEAARFKSMKKWWWRIMYRYEKFAHSHADFNFFITEEDKIYATSAYNMNPDKCAVITYGTEEVSAPTPKEKNDCKQSICAQLNIPETTKLLLFNGTLNYAPNEEGLNRILKDINPLLMKNTSAPYQIIICGLRLPEQYNNLQHYQNQNIIYKGFVEDINSYFKGADIFLNPIVDGGGIKTKLVEALAADADAVSFKAGAYGIPDKLTGAKLITVADNDCNAFANAVIEKIQQPSTHIPHAFFEHFSWDAIAKKAMDVVNSLK